MSRFRFVRVLYATVTGTSQDVAHEIAERYSLCNIPVVGCSTVDEYDFQNMLAHASRATLFVFVISTSGDGESPPCMRRFWTSLRNASLPRGCFHGLQAAIFGLGDRSYPKFNAAARRLAIRMSDLGASLVVPLALGDDADVLGYDEALRPWMNALFQATVDGYEKLHVPNPLPPAKPLWDVVLYSPDKSSSGKECPSSELCRKNVGKWKRQQILPEMQLPGRRRAKIVEAVVARNCVITNPAELHDEREVRHIELDLSDVNTFQHPLFAPEHNQSQFLGLDFGHYVPGDVVCVMPRNRKSAVHAFLQLTQIDGNQLIALKHRNYRGQDSGISQVVGLAEFSNEFDIEDVAHGLNLKTPCRVDEFVAAQLDLNATPRRRFFECLAFFAHDEMHKTKLNELASSEYLEDFIQYVHREKRTILMVLRDFPSARPPLSYLIDMIPRLQPRAFSIASSRQAHDTKLHICAAMVKYVTPLRFARIGVCSSFWSQAEVGDVVPIFLDCGSLKFDEKRAAILVGPGTGIAPMRSFISSLSSTEYGCTAITRVLFFGCRHQKGDFLYEEEWTQAVLDGRLSHAEVAFSRDDPSKKKYVQDQMMACAPELWALLADSHGGSVYIAGASGDMPKSVRTAIVKIVVQEGHCSTVEAEKFVKELERSRRLQIECW